MSKPIEIIAFANGDSAEPSTWSGVPYFLLSAIEEKGAIVHRVNIKLEDRNIIARYFCKVGNKIIRLLSGGSGGVLILLIDHRDILISFKELWITRLCSILIQIFF